MDILPPKAEYARKYLEFVPPALLVYRMVESATQNSENRLTDAGAQSLLESLMSESAQRELMSICEKGLINTFTEDELRHLAEFYGSELGRSALSKMGKYAEAINPQLEKLVSSLSPQREI